MKELTTEEKAKRYDEAIKVAKIYHNSCNEDMKTMCETMFPELKESEDEKIRKELIFYLGDMPEDTELRNGVTNRDVLAWLKKQGEHANFRSKIQIGDKVTRNDSGVLVNLSQFERVAKKLKSKMNRNLLIRLNQSFMRGSG